MIKGRPTMASPVALHAQAASLRRDYPRWHFIVSSAGRIWAQTHIVVRLATGATLWDFYECVEGDTAREVREKIAAKEGR